MSGNIKGITIEFRGETSSLEQALRKINSETRTIDQELKKVNNALKFNPNSVELWKQKQTLLNQKLKETNEKAKLLKSTLEDYNAGKIELTEEEVRELKRELIEAESKAKHFDAELKKIGNANLKALSMQLKEIGGKLTDVGQTMTTKVTAPIVAGYAAATKYASDYEENLNKLDVAFGDNSQAVKDWANTSREQFGLSKVQATESASAFGALGKGIGLSEGKAADMSTTLAGLSADLGSYFNVGVDESSKALEGIFTGESEALKKFGVVMTDTNLQKFAEDQGKVWKEMDQTEKTMLRYQYVLAKTKDAQGDFSRTGDGTANSTKVFQASIQDLATAIGTNLIPVVTPLIQKITQLINKFDKLSPEAQKVITMIGLAVAAIGPLILIIGTLITSVGKIIGVVNSAGTIIAGLASPIGIAIAAIAAIIAIGVLLYKNWDTIKKKAQELWTKIKTVFTGIKTTVTTTWNYIKSYITGAITTVVKTVVAKIQSMKTTITTVFAAIRATINAVWAGIKASVQGAVSSMASSVTSRISSMKSSISSAFYSIKSTAAYAWNGIKNAIIRPITTAKNTLSSMLKKIKGMFPLKVGKIFTNLKVPKIVVSKGESPFGIGGKGKAPSISVQWHAKGGIFKSPTLLAGAGGLHGVGEAGAEAIVPLDMLWDKLDRIAEASSSGGVVVQVYGTPNMSVNELAAAVEQRLVQMQKRRMLAWQ